MKSQVAKAPGATGPVVLTFFILIQGSTVQEIHHISCHVTPSTIMPGPDVLSDARSPDIWSHRYLKHLQIRTRMNKRLVLGIFRGCQQATPRASRLNEFSAKSEAVEGVHIHFRCILHAFSTCILDLKRSHCCLMHLFHCQHLLAKFWISRCHITI